MARLSDCSFDILKPSEAKERETLIDVTRIKLSEVLSYDALKKWFGGLEEVVANEYKTECVVFRVDPNGVECQVMEGYTRTQGTTHVDTITGDYVSIIVHLGSDEKTTLV